MSDEKKYTAREYVEAQRAAFVSGVHRGADAWGCVDPESVAKARYPLPNVRRPRVVKDPHESKARWRWYPQLGEFGVAAPDISDGDFYAPTSGIRWQPTPARVAMWADLLAHHTEEVEADA